MFVNHVEEYKKKMTTAPSKKKKEVGGEKHKKYQKKKTVIELYLHTHKHKQHLRLSNKRHDAVLTERQKKKEGTNVRYKKKRSVRQPGNKKQKPKSEVTKKRGFHTKLISKCMRCLPVFPTCSISEKKMNCDSRNCFARH